jgi:hypothetical protein
MGALPPFFYYGYIMNDFLIEIVYDATHSAYVACYSSGYNITLDATTYQDAVCEADMIEQWEYA